ncbi:hypothetical protein HPULCUR_006538, partial [Helicostylum pulchrum]
RKDYMDDGDDSSDEESGRINFDITDADLEAELAGFNGTTQRKRRHNNNDSSEDDEDIPVGLGARGGLGLGPAFKPAQSQTPEDSPRRKDPVKEKVVRAKSSASPSPGPGFAQFNKHSKGFGQKMLEKMGWTGKGLGADGEGIVNPVETKLRPARMGLSFRGFDERTDQAKYEAKTRNGDDESEDEDEAPKGKRRNAWKAKEKNERGETGSTHRKSRKPKTVYKTAAEIIAETEEGTTTYTATSSAQQKVIDMTGPSIREISIADIKRTDSPTLMEVTTRLPELRHNLRLIVDLARNDLENLSREKKSNSFKMQSLQEELKTIQSVLDKEQDHLRKLEEVKVIAKNLEKVSKDALATGAFENGNVTALFGEQFDILERDFVNELKEMNIDALVIAVWAPVWKYRSMTWNVLEDPTWGLIDVKKWKKLLTSNDDDDAERGWVRTKKRKDLVCTPFETMMNTIWLSKVRSAIK